MWQDEYHISWAEKDGVLFVRGGGKRDTFLLAPFAGEDGTFIHGLELAKQYFKETGEKFLLRGVNTAIRERLERLCPDCYRFEADRDNFEYIYRTQDLIQLSGKKYKQKKNHLNQFRMQYSNYEYEPISEANIDECRAMAKRWAEEHADEEGVFEELDAIYRLFDAWEALGLKGGVIRLYGRIAAFTIGELLHDHLALVHIEKADANIRGLYQAINQEFLKHTFADVEFVNREEDMGLPGLRQAKESYHPVRFAEKYNVYCLQEERCMQAVKETEE